MELMNFQEVKELIKNAIEFSLLDVRDEEERLVPGRIPSSVNVPFPELVVAFNSSEQDFVDKYDFRKPELDHPKLTVYCHDGVRAKRAAHLLTKTFGYQDIRLYEGGFKDWVEKGGEVIRGYGHRLVEFEEVQQGIHDGTMTLIDTRNHDERENPGKIPNDYVLPLPEFWEGFYNLKEEEFLEKHGFSRPNRDTQNVVLYCRTGKRARDAADKLFLLNYHNFGIYKGSFTEWTKKKGGSIKTFSNVPKVVMVQGSKDNIALKQMDLKDYRDHEEPAWRPLDITKPSGVRRKMILFGKDPQLVDEAANQLALMGHEVQVCKD